MRIIFKSALERLGFEVVGTAKDGKEALDRCVETKPDIILLDMALEGMDCVTLTRAITERDPQANVILLVAEDSGDPNSIIEAVRAGVKGYIRKPVSVEELETRLANMLRRRQ